MEQKRAFNDALDRLERVTLTAPSNSPEEALIRTQESRMIIEYITRARNMDPDGVVVIVRDGSLLDMLLEDGDILVIPQKRDVVHVSGEVQIAKTMAFKGFSGYEDYINASGGFTRRADRNNILVVHANGDIQRIERGRFGRMRSGQHFKDGMNPGDHIVVLPRHESKNLLLIKDLTQIMYQMAIATKVMLDVAE